MVGLKPRVEDLRKVTYGSIKTCCVLVITDNDPNMHIRGHCQYSHQPKKTF